MNQPKEFNSFAEFYPYYLEEHSNQVCRILHYIGSSLVLIMLAYIIFSGRWGLVWILPLIGYGFAWVGHYFFEKNKPATFQYPLYSFMGDWVMLKDFLLGRFRH